MNPNENSAYRGADVLEVMAAATNYNAYLLDLVLRGRDPADELVDFGAGSGTFAQMLSDRGFSVQCIEPDAGLSGRLSGHGLPVVSSVRELQGVKFLYSLNVLEHIEDDQSALREIFEQLEPGGMVFFYVPAFMLLFTSMDEKVGHYRRYTRKQLVTLFQQAGFVPDEARYADSLGFLVALILKMFRNKSWDINPRALKIYDRLIFPLSRLCDLVLFPLLGKNVMIRAHKPDPASHEG